MNFKGLKGRGFLTSVIFTCLVCLAMTQKSVNAAPLIADGSFEKQAGNISGFNNGTFLANGKDWAVYATPNMAVCVVGNDYNTNQFFSTAHGTQFLWISCDPHNIGHNPNSAVAQAISTPLTAGTTYKIAFQQCCFKDQALKGSVNVEVVPNAGGGFIYNKTFTVEKPAQGWKAKSDTFTVPANATGQYTLVFIADNQAKVAIVDDISLTAE